MTSTLPAGFCFDCFAPYIDGEKIFLLQQFGGVGVSIGSLGQRRRNSKEGVGVTAGREIGNGASAEYQVRFLWLDRQGHETVHDARQVVQLPTTDLAAIHTGFCRLTGEYATSEVQLQAGR